VILTSWVGHNRKHSEKFGKWMEKADNPKGNTTYDSAVQAAQELKKANERLSQALTELQKKR